MEMARLLIHLIWSASLLGSIAGCRNPITEAITNEEFEKAIRSDDVNAVRELIKSGANVNARGWAPDGGAFATVEFTPLHHAAVGSSPEIVKLLLDAGADIHAKSYKHAATPILIAHHHEIIALLAEAGGDVNERDAPGRTLLFNVLDSAASPYATVFDPKKSVQALIEAGADTTEGGFTPLHWSAATGNVKEMRRLISAGADINAVDDRASWTPLHVAALCGQAASIRVLAEAGADLDRLHKKHRLKMYPSPFGPNEWTALHLATVAGMTEAVKALVDAGANVNAGGTYGGPSANMTPLHFAASTSQVDYRTQADAIRILLDAGADPFAKSDDGRTPLDFATLQDVVTEDDKATIAILREAMKEGKGR